MVFSINQSINLLYVIFLLDEVGVGVTVEIVALT